MIQRIQSIYLLLVIVALLTITFGANFFSYKIDKQDNIDLTIKLNVFGIQADGEFQNLNPEDEKKINQFLKLKERSSKITSSPVVSFPFYLIAIFLILLSIATLLSFKKLETQQKLGRINFVAILTSFIFVIIIFYASRSQVRNAIEDIEFSSRLGLSFYAMIVATAFAFLANIGIKRDLDLIKSIDRIR